MEQHNASQDNSGQGTQEAIAFYETLIASIASDLRTPLSIIAGYLELLLSGGKLDADDRRMVEISMVGAQRLTRLIDNLAAVPALKSGRLEIRPVDMQLRTLVDMVRTNMELDAKEKHLTLSMTVDAAIPDTIYHDEYKLRLIVNNLVSNSIKFTPEDGQVAVVFQLNGDRMQIDVTDTSMPIPVAAMERFAEMVQQSGISGLGLGLALVIRLTHLMGGTVRVRSEAEFGNTFTVELPLELR